MKKIAVVLIMCLTTMSIFSQIAQNSKIYDLKNIHGIDAGELSNIVIKIGNESTLKIEDIDESEPEFEINDGILKLKSGNSGNMKNMRFIISLPEIDFIKLNGISKISSENVVKGNKLVIKAMGASKVDLDIDVKQLFTEISGASKISLRGKAIEHKIEISGASGLNAQNLETLSTEINGSGIAKANLDVKNELKGKLTGLSVVTYKNEPDVNNLIYAKKDELIENNDSLISEKVVSKKILKAKDNDTTKISIFGSDIEVINGSKTKINIGNKELSIDDNGNVKFKKNDKTYIHKFRGHWGGFELAYNGYMNSDFGTKLPAKYDFLKLNDVKSVGVNLNVIELNVNILNNKLGIVSGAGLQWNNYRFSDNIVLVPDSSTIYGFHNNTINSYIKSKLVESWVRIPLFIEYQTAQRKSKQFHLAVGGILDYKIGSHSKQVHFEGGERNKDKIYDDFHLNNIRLDSEVRIGWGPINIFATYSLTKLFKENQGPELYPYSIGLTLVGW